MSETKKIRLAWAAFLFVLLHTAAIVIYAFPEPYLPRPIKNISSYYVSPVFMQTWNLFAPAPLHNANLSIKYIYQNDTTDWLNPLDEDLKKHQMYRMTYHGDLTVGQSNLLFFLANDIRYLGISIYDDFPEDSLSALQKTSSYWLTRNYVYGLSTFKYNKEPDAAIVKCHYQNVQTLDSGSFVLPAFNFLNTHEK